MSDEALPPGYVRGSRDGTRVVVRDWAADAVARALAAHRTLDRWAAAQPAREALRGRGITWAVVLDAGAGGERSTPVVVRHSRHGGQFAALTGDLFPRPTRAPRELVTSARLAAAGVRTPEVVAFTIHPVAGILARSDVMTRRLPPGRDFPEAWRAATSDAARDALLQAVGTLLRTLSAAGAQHADLNVKNVYVAGDDAPAAYVLDVDRVRFVTAAHVAARNFARFARSARKWRAQHGLEFGDAELVRIASLAWVEP